MNSESSNTLATYGASSLTGEACEHKSACGKVGLGMSTAHHGELFQGVLKGTDGRLHYSLMSLPCELFQSEAIFFPNITNVIRVEPNWKTKALKAAELTLASNGNGRLVNQGGLLKIRSNIPVGWGLGSSTSDVVATIRAVADSFQLKVNPGKSAHLAVAAESASDSIMFNERLVLFAQREGIVLEDFGGPLPELEVLGFNTDPAGKGVETLSYSLPRYSWREIESFRPLIGLLRRAIRTQNPLMLGRVASASAALNQQYLPTPHFARLTAITGTVGAIGLQIAHSGTVAGLLFDPALAGNESRIERAKELIAELGFEQVWYFRTRKPDYNEQQESQ